jgi:ribosomal-protein-alanine N-acetyltransferase
LTIRPLGRADVEACIAMEQQATPFHWSWQQLDSGLRAGNCGWMVTAGSGPLGYCLVQMLPAAMEFLNLVVSPAHRRQGLGRQLLDSALDFGAKQGADQAWLEVRASNRAATHLYRSAGFIETGLRKGYYRTSNSGQKEDARVMSLDFPGRTSVP